MAVQSTLREDPLIVLYRHYVGLLRAKLHLSSRRSKFILGSIVFCAIVGSGYGGYDWWLARLADRRRVRRLLKRNSSIIKKDGSRVVYVPDQSSVSFSNVSAVPIRNTKQTTFEAHRRLFLRPPKSAGLSDGGALVPSPATKPGLNLAFLHQFVSLLSIMVPRWRSKETGLLVSHGVFLMFRTYLSLLISRLDGIIVRDLVAGRGKSFAVGLVKWVTIGTFASYVNAMIKFLREKISIAFRTRLTRYTHDLYVNENCNYYKLTNLDGGVTNGADQYITQDLTLFCSASASLYSSIGKPLVDLVVFNYQLYRSLGPLALSGILGGYFSTATVLRRLAPPFGKLTAVEGKKEGDFRGLHSRLLANAEEIAFYRGADLERDFLNKSFRDLQRWMEGIYKLKIKYNMLEDVILKYAWSAFGYLITSLPIFLPAWSGAGSPIERLKNPEVADRERGRMKEFITNKRLMLSLADAGGRLMYSIKDLSELAGYTSRVYTLISTLHRVHANSYHMPPGSHTELYSLSDVQGTIHNGFDGVRLEQVPIVAPSLFPRGGDELIESLSFIVRSGEHLLITGSNGVGKSAIARIVSGIWPVYRGLVSRPRHFGLDGIMFLPQRPYLCIGTLRDQVIYPHSEMDMRQTGISDDDLHRILKESRLDYLPAREGGWDTRKEWKDVLSGGEKQRMAMARMFYHEPHYAFLDEATSAVSQDVEGLLYENAKERGITIITISTRLSLKKYHAVILTLGVGPEGLDWELNHVGTEKEKMSVEKEIQELKQKLDNVDNWERRRNEINEELKKVFVSGGELPPPPNHQVEEVQEETEQPQEHRGAEEVDSSLVEIGTSTATEEPSTADETVAEAQSEA